MQVQEKHIASFLSILAFAFGCNYHVPNVTTTTQGTNGDTDDPEEQTIPTPSKEGIYNMACWNGNEVNWSGQLDKSHYIPDFVHACAKYEMTEDTPTTGNGDVDNWEASVRAACTRHCKKISFWENYHCEDAGWTKIEPAAGVWQKCASEADLDIDLIETVLGSGAAKSVLDLPCELAFTCEDYLDVSERMGLWTGSSATVRLSADTLVQTVANGASSVGLGPDTTAMAGSAAFTATSCGAGACPFYLAQFDLTQTMSWDVTVAPLPGEPAKLTKRVTALQLGLKQPALGVWLPGSGDVIFPPDSLLLRAQATLAGPTNDYGENGSHDLLYSNPSYVFGHVSFAPGTSRLDIQAAGKDLLGPWSLEGEFQTQER